MSTTEPRTVRPGTWCCPRCGRSFARPGQSHSCAVVDLEHHLPDDHPMRPVFTALHEAVTRRLGTCTVLALPCCIHLVGAFDVVAVLPKRDRLEVRFTLHRELDDARVRRVARTSQRAYKHRVDVRTTEDVDQQLLAWIEEAHDLRGG